MLLNYRKKNRLCILHVYLCVLGQLFVQEIEDLGWFCSVSDKTVICRHGVVYESLSFDIHKSSNGSNQHNKAHHFVANDFTPKPYFLCRPTVTLFDLSPPPPLIQMNEWWQSWHWWKIRVMMMLAFNSLLWIKLLFKMLWEVTNLSSGHIFVNEEL